MPSLAKAGDRLKARVVSHSDHGIQLEAVGVTIQVHVTDVEWYRLIRPSQYAGIGEELEVVILRATEDGKVAAGWLPWPNWYLAKLGKPDPGR